MAFFREFEDKRISERNQMNCTAGEKVRTMSLEAIEKVTEVERKNKERRAAAETEAKQMLASA